MCFLFFMAKSIFGDTKKDTFEENAKVSKELLQKNKEKDEEEEEYDHVEPIDRSLQMIEEKREFLK